MPPQKINLSDAAAALDQHWTPRVLTAVSGHEVKISKLSGEFVWHQHDDADELFLIVSGTLRLRFRDGEVTLNPGEMLTVPAGVEHLPIADEEVVTLVFEPAGVNKLGDKADSPEGAAFLSD